MKISIILGFLLWMPCFSCRDTDFSYTEFVLTSGHYADFKNATKLRYSCKSIGAVEIECKEKIYLEITPLSNDAAWKYKVYGEDYDTTSIYRMINESSYVWDVPLEFDSKSFLFSNIENGLYGRPMEASADLSLRSSLLTENGIMRLTFSYQNELMKNSIRREWWSPNFGLFRFTIEDTVEGIGVEHFVDKVYIAGVNGSDSLMQDAGRKLP